MHRLHVNLRVDDLDAATRFYSTLFAAEPTLRKDDYAKWLLDDPRVNFSVVARGGEPGFGHLGIQAETPEELAALRRRIDRLEGRVDDEGQTVCCYHHSDKTWVTDAQGIAWEAFHSTGVTAGFDDAYEREPAAAQAACCGADAAEGSEAACCDRETERTEACCDRNTAGTDAACCDAACCAPQAERAAEVSGAAEDCAPGAACCYPGSPCCEDAEVVTGAASSADRAATACCT